MKILELRLEGCERLFLNRIRVFHLTLKDIIQLILGTNASGKSTIVYELTPLPADKNYYTEDGKKWIKIEHNGRDYELTNDFAKGAAAHSFIMEGEELNDAGLITRQRELVYEHFGINQEIHNLLIGKELFTNMSSARRREWLTKLCTVDYTYAIQTYKKVMESVKDTQGALKRTKKRLSHETSISVDPEESRALRERLNALTKQSQEMYMLRESSVTAIGDYLPARSNISTAIFDLIDRWRDVKQPLAVDCYTSLESSQVDVDDARARLAGTLRVYQDVSQQYMELSQEIGGVNETPSQDIQSLQQKVVEIHERVVALKASRKLNLNFPDPGAAENTLVAALDQLMMLMLEMPANEQGQYSQEQHTQLGDRVRALEATLANSERKLTELRHQEQSMQELKNSQDITCPECQHTFKHGYQAKLHDKLLERIDSGAKYCQQLKADLAQAMEALQSSENYVRRLREYHQLTRAMPSCNPLWVYIADKGMLKQSPSQVSMTIELARRDLEIDLKAVALCAEAQGLVQNIERAKFAETESFKGKKARLEKLEEYIGQLVLVKKADQERLTKELQTQKSLQTLQSISQQLQATLDKTDRLDQAIIDALKNEVIDMALREVHEEIAKLSNRLGSIDTHQALIEDLKAELATLEEDEQAWKLLAQCLSPVDGLIADGMLGFIRHFVGKMNDFIAGIWTFPMTVLDCSLEENSAELNYKFPVKTDNIKKPVPDVSLGSEGMMEVINLTFRLIAARYLGQSKAPLVLDEFGRTFDEAHRDAVTRVISQLVESGEYPQVFMISHYESSYGAFYNAQVTVVDRRNITIPSGRAYNEHTVIETA